jgi:predicted RNase H-like nuclease
LDAESTCFQRIAGNRKELTKEITMAENEAKTCAHEPCLCTVADSEKYCSDACRDAGSKEVEIACQCQHPACLDSV